VVQDAEFFIKTPTNPNIITSDATWNNNKAKIIYGDLTIDQNVILNIQQGTKVISTKQWNESLSGATRISTVL
jgi:hypothetical protein